MTTDKLFILLLVILLPLTGCLDIADTAEAEDSDEETTIVNNYYNNTTTTTMPNLYTIFIAQGDNTTLTFDGSESMFIESIYRGQLGSNAPQGISNAFYFSMNCNGISMVENGYIIDDEYIPVLPDQNCSVTFDVVNDYFITYSKHAFGSL